MKQIEEGLLVDVGQFVLQEVHGETGTCTGGRSDWPVPTLGAPVLFVASVRTVRAEPGAEGQTAFELVSASTRAYIPRTMDRIATLSSFVESDPTDPFPLYGLAMEYGNQKRFDEAKERFQTLVDKFPDYLATYLMYGGVLASLGDTEAAAAMYQRGIEVSEKAGDAHTKSELQAALGAL